MQSKSVRDRILEYFDRNQVASIAEISSTLGVTKPNIHYHIKTLIHSGIIEVIKNKVDVKGRIKGRPVLYYRRTNRSKPENYQILSKHLLHFYFHDSNSETGSTSKLVKLAKALAGGNNKEPGSFIQRMQNAIMRLNTLNYDPHWEVSQSGPVIYFRHCPYSDILPEFPTLCQVDLLLLEILTKSSLRLTAKIYETSRLPPACIFLIQLEKIPWISTNHGNDEPSSQQ